MSIGSGKMNIKGVKKALNENFIKMTKDQTHLFEVDLDKDELWNLYLDSFPTGTNEIYRVRREHDCSACRQFIKKIGNVVTIQDGVVKSVWDFETNDIEYKPVMETLAAFVKSRSVSDVWINKFPTIGIDTNYEQSEDGKIIEWEHFYLEIPSKFVMNSSKSVEEIRGDLRSTKDVFKRSLEEITEDSILTVLELMASNSLYKGEEWKGVLSEFLKYKKAYSRLSSDDEKNNFAWEQSTKAGAVIGRIRNHSIGVLLVDVSEGMELDEAVRKYEKIVAPENYRRPKAIFTKKMLEDAQKTIEELGYMDSLPRRYATLDDITVNNILFSNKDSAKRIEGIFEEMSKDVTINPKKFSKIEEVPIDKFVEKILPSARELEILFENKHSNNMVSLIAPANRDAPTMFKWSNAFSWAYSGNITDSSMKENVKNAGGNVEGILRFSIQWNDSEYNPNDFDAHCIEPNCYEIYYAQRNSETTGQLDVDIIHPEINKPAVENITWTDKFRMLKGTYKFFVRNYNHNGGRTGFKAEIEFNGQIYSFEYNKELRFKEDVQVAEVTFDGSNFTIKEKLPSNVSSREVWGLKTYQFVPVSVVCYSPNYWDLQNGIGHRHYFFILKDCLNPETPNGFYNEFLKRELEQHKRVFEALASKIRVQYSDDQLSGIGFSSTKRNELIIKVKAQTERVIKVKF
jgi:hypothetical protein